jgi:hypothetical protein
VIDLVPSATAKPEGNLPREIRRVNIALLLVFAALLAGPAIATWWLSQQYPSVSTVDIDQLTIVENAELCPGDPLIYRYDFHALGAGVLVRDRTIWQVTPPKTVIFSDARRFILTDAINQSLTEAWHIPVSYLNPATDEVDHLAPGAYQLLYSISSPSKSSIVDIESTNFTIRADCP